MKKNKNTKTTTQAPANQELYDAFKREQHLKMVLMGVRNVNQLITKETDAQTLISKACINLTETLSYYNAWIALTDENGKVTHTAFSGNEKEFRKLEKQLRAGKLPSCVLSAKRNNDLTVIDVPSVNCPDCPLSKAYTGRSGLCYRLAFNTRNYGFITVSAPGEYAQLKEEHELFIELADDLGFALYKIETELRKLDAEKQLTERVKELTCLFAISRDMQLNLSEANFFENAIQHLSKAMRYQEIAVPVIELSGREYPGDKKISKSWKGMFSEIKIANKVVGKISVFYSKDKPFLLPDEQNLLDHISHSIGIWLEHKQSVEALRENEARLKQITNNITDVVFITDMNLNTTYVSPSVEKLTGIPVEEYLKKANHERHPEETLLHLKAIFMEELKKDKEPGVDKNRTRIVDGEHFLPDGSTINISMHTSFLRDEKGKPVGLQGVTRDITPQKLAEKELLESKNFIQLVMDNLPIGIAVNNISPQVQFEYVNDNFFKIYRTTKEALSSAGSFWDAVYENPGFREEIKKKVVDDVLSEIPERMVWKDIPITRKGEETTHITAMNIPLPENDILISTVWDVTDRMLAIEQLRTSDRIFNHALDMLCIAGYDGYFKVLNPSWSRVLGWSKEELLAKPWIEFVHPDDKTATINVGSILVDNKEVYQFENRYICKDGSVKWLSWNSFPYPGEKIMYGVARDITQDKLLKLELLESKERFRILHNASFGGIAIHDKGLILDCNKGLSDMTGYTYDELVGMDGLLLIAESNRKMVMNKIHMGYEKPYEAIGVRKNGQEYPIRLEARNIPYKGKIARSVEFRDITEQKNTEAEILKAKEKAQESDRLKTSFLNNMSHEIRTPMNGLLGFTQLITEPDISAKDREYYSRIIMQSGYQLLSIIDDIINIATIEAGQEQLRETKTDLNRMLDTLYMQFKNRMNTGQVMINYQTKLSQQQAMIITDQTKLMQVLSNLLGNAQKFTEQGSIEFDCKLQNNHLLFCVKDTGIGIESKHHEAIFNRFRQVSTETTREYGGNGLGLAISKAYVELMGGIIWVESEPGKGSTFYFTLPGDARHTHTDHRERDSA
jgi:PAS domain S-box-containing protein